MRSQSRSYCFPMNFAKFVRNTFFTEISGRLLLFRLKCKLKLWLQSKRIYTPLLTNFHIWINTIATTAKNLKFYSKWAVRSIVHLAHSKIDCSLVKRVINGTCVRAFTWRLVVGEMNYFEMLDWFSFYPGKNFL